MNSTSPLTELCSRKNWPCHSLHAILDENRSQDCWNQTTACSFANNCSFDTIALCKDLDSDRFGHGLNVSFSLFLGMCFLLIIILAVAGNAILIFTIVTVRKLHSITHVFIVNLAVGDLITALFTMPFDVDFMWRGYFAHGTFLCGMMNTSFFLSLPSSVINLCLLTVDRFVSVKWPLQKVRWLGKPFVVVILLVSWTYTVMVASFVVIHNPNSVFVLQGVCYMYPIPKAYHLFQLIVNFFIPITIIVTINILIFVIANKHGREALRRQRHLQACLNSQVSQNALATSLGANIKAAKRILLLVGVFIVCWLFYILFVVHNFSCGGCHPRELTWMTNVVNYSSCSINPILYGLLNKAVRKEVWIKMHMFWGKCIGQDPMRSDVLKNLYGI